MEIVLDTPVIPQHLSILAHSHPAAADKVMHFRTNLAGHAAFAVADAYSRRLRPRGPVTQTFDIMDDHIGTLLMPAMTVFTRRVLRDNALSHCSVQRLLNGCLDVLQQVFLVTFDGQNVIAAAGHDLLGNLFLAAH